ncbi:MAG: spermidine synthase [Myxococcota bacterium]|jgi:spermidine synthase
MNWILYAIFALSGAVSLAFETLWFRQAGLTFGNSVWASSLVLSSFMAGIAFGNAIAARYAARLARPILGYAALEAVIAISGVFLVYTLPAMGDGIAAVLRPFFDQPLILNPLRLALGFLVLFAPATAMGATLPLVVRAMHARDPNFGSVLGRLYGTNTLGAMVGAVVGEAVLIEWLGIRGTSLLVGSLGLCAALGAVYLAKSLPVLSTEDEQQPSSPNESLWSTGALPILLAAFMSGAILLALEVVWFRFLHLFAHGGGHAFALMLAMVLLGIGLGGYAGGAWIRRDPKAFRHSAALAFVSGCTSVAVYVGFHWVIAPYRMQYVRDVEGILWLTFCLTFLPSLLSGVLFTLLGAALERKISPDSRATGLLTLFNTFGAGLGSVIAGFVLLPSLGMESSFLLLSGLYGLVALLLLRTSADDGIARKGVPKWVAGFAFVTAIALFPTGMMESDYLQRPVKRFRGTMDQVAEMREGVLQTVIYLRRELDGEFLYYRMITDGYSMSGTAEGNSRYMRLFVYWPIAMHEDPKKALLISYGVGETAKALTEAQALEHIDVVDISPEILDSSSIIYPDESTHPLYDPRVTVHTEDGRYFLKTTQNRYDLITGEPPPPKIAGVVSLYTREYFELIYDRLNEGGINTYWLPVHNLTQGDTNAIIRAYCDVFEDCALWSGNHLDWILTGSRNLKQPPPLALFTRQWEDPVVGQKLRDIGIDSPELMGALFMAGPAQLRELTADTAPLIDDYPKRIGNEIVGATIAEIYRPMMDATLSRKRFESSDYITAMWPAALRESTIEHFGYQKIMLETSRAFGISNQVLDIHKIISNTPYEYIIWRLLDQDGDSLRAVRNLVAAGAPEGRYPLRLATDAIVQRDFKAAARHTKVAFELTPRVDRLLFLHLYTLCMAGDIDAAQQLTSGHGMRFGMTPEGQQLRTFLRNEFGIKF